MSAGLALQARTLAARTAFAAPYLLSSGTRMASLGDSITAQYDYGTGYKSPQGYQSWAEVLSAGALYTDAALNFGVASNTTAQMRERVGQVIAARPGLCVVLGGINDKGLATPAQTIANLRAIYAALVAAGILVVAVPILPASVHGGSALTQVQHRRIAQINGWIRAYVAQGAPGIVLADPTPMLIDATSVLGTPLGGAPSGISIPTAVTYDGLHPSIRGGYWTGRAIVEALRPRLVPAAHGLLAPQDVFDAVDNPGGSKLGNDWWTGATGGTLLGGSTGAVPAGWTLQRTSATGNAAGAFENEALDSGAVLRRYRLDLTGGAGSPCDVRLYRQLFPASAAYAAGELVEGLVEIDIGNVGADSLTRVQLEVSDGAGSFVRTLGNAGGSGAGDYLYPNTGWNGLLRTKPFTIVNAAFLSFILSFSLAGVAGAAVTVRLRRASLRRVVS